MTDIPTITQEEVVVVRALARLDAKTDKREPDECWPWLGKLHDGYGHFSFNGMNMKAHRAAVILAGRAIPKGMMIDHKCRNRACVNPTHLRIVDHRTNTLENSAAVTALNAAKTHCRNGHVFSKENTLVTGSPPRRDCRTCKRERQRISRGFYAKLN